MVRLSLIRIGAAVLFVFGSFSLLKGWVTPAGDPEILACVARATGQLRVVASGDACRPNETLLSWGASGPQGPVGATGAPGPAGPGGTGLAVIDATDQTVGLLTAAFPQTAAIAVEATDGTWVVVYGTTDFSRSSSTTEYFEFPDCQGSAYWRVAPSLVAWGSVRDDEIGRKIIYYPDSSDTRGFIPKSQINDTVTGSGPCQNIPIWNQTTTMTLSPSLRQIDVSHFVPPFRAVKQ